MKRRVDNVPSGMSARSGAVTVAETRTPRHSGAPPLYLRPQIRRRLRERQAGRFDGTKPGTAGWTAKAFDSLRARSALGSNSAAGADICRATRRAAATSCRPTFGPRGRAADRHRRRGRCTAAGPAPLRPEQPSSACRTSGTAFGSSGAQPSDFPLPPAAYFPVRRRRNSVAESYPQSPPALDLSAARY